MSNLFLFLLAFACIHYVYEQILLPSIRQSLRSEFFELRDLLREKQHEIYEEGLMSKKLESVFSGVDERIKFAADNVNFFNVYNFIKTLLHSKARENSEGRSEFIIALLECDEEAPKDIYKQVLQVIDKSVVANSFLFFLYLTPVVICLAIISRVVKAMTDKLNLVSEQLLKDSMRSGNKSSGKSLVTT